MDDEIWDVRFHFDGEDNLERTLSRSDITVLNLYALVEIHGYGIRDPMYYVKEKGKGMAGMEMVDSMAKVQKMLTHFKQSQVLQLYDFRNNAKPPASLNMDIVEEQSFLSQACVMAVDNAGVTHISDDDENSFYPVAVDFSDVLYLGTQQSSNKGKGKKIASVDLELEDSDEGLWCG